MVGWCKCNIVVSFATDKGSRPFPTTIYLMDIQTFLINSIQDKSQYQLTRDDEKSIQNNGIEWFIFNKLNSSKYKATSIDEEYKKKIQDKIHLCVSNNQPIHISLPFGATKNPNLPTAPHIDWGEVFNIVYIRNYLKPISNAYKYGVILEYVSVAVFEEKVNRIPKKDSDMYDSEFSSLIKHYQQFLPVNFRLNFIRVEDTISRVIAEKRMDLKIAELRKAWPQMSAEIKQNKLFRAKRNCIYDPNDKSADDIILNAVFGHDAFCSECWTTEPAPWDKPDMITLGHNYTEGWAIHVRSTTGSSVNFWSGIGVLIKKGDSFIPTVLSPQQYDKEKKNITEIKSDLFDKKFKTLQTLPYI